MSDFDPIHDYEPHGFSADMERERTSGYSSHPNVVSPSATAATPTRIQLENVIFGEIAAELNRQVGKWGVQTHEPLMWAAILGEEVGEVSKEILENWHQNNPNHDPEGKAYRKELIQVAAVAVSAVRALDMCNDTGDLS